LLPVLAKGLAYPVHPLKLILKDQHLDPPRFAFNRAHFFLPPKIGFQVILENVVYSFSYKLATLKKITP
jgi:hypothetical protein